MPRERSWHYPSTATLSDALDRLGLTGAILGIHPLAVGMSFAGPAFTVRYLPVSHDGGSVGDYVDDVPPGSVVALDNAGRLDCTVWGDILTVTAVKRGLAATVIDGVCRDSSSALLHGFPIFSRGAYMRTGKDRVYMESTECPVDIGGRRVLPGDVLVGDGDGVVVVPSAEHDRVLDCALEIEAAETRIVEAVLGSDGATLREIRREHRYHDLQSPTEGT